MVYNIKNNFKITSLLLSTHNLYSQRLPQLRHIHEHFKFDEKKVNALEIIKMVASRHLISTGGYNMKEN